MRYEDQKKDIAEAAKGADSPAAEENAKAAKRRRSLGAHFLILTSQTLLLAPIYLALLTAAFAAGVGWFYMDESATLEIERVSRPDIGALVRDAHGVEIGRVGSKNQILVTREEIPDHFVDALVAAEDQRFFTHPGFDPLGSVRAALANYQSDAIREGGSTLTQQLARDIFRLEGRSIDRKLAEIAAAVRIERRYTKDEILVHYLNRVYFGSGFYGIGAAARGYFGKKTSELTVDQSALICGIIPSPSRYSPLISPDRARENRDQTLRRMRDRGSLDEEDWQHYMAIDTPVASSRDDSLGRGQTTYLITRVERELRAEIATWASAPDSLDGFEIETSVDLVGQQEAARKMDRHLRRIPGVREEGDKLEAAFLVMENRSGQVVLSVGSRDFRNSEFDRTVEMKRPPGSAFLPFLYAAAYERGPFTPETMLLDAPFNNRDMGLGSVGGVLGEWSTENPKNHWQGRISAKEALAKSKNSPSARLGLHVGLENMRKTAKAMGITSELRDIPGSLLGASEATLLELVRAYTVFPNEGVPAPAPRLIREIRDASGKVVARPASYASARAIKATTARSIVAALPASGKLPGARGKSGTTPIFTDAWYFGFDAEHTWGMWIGRDQFTPIRSLAFGGELVQPLVEEILASQKAGTADAVPSVSSEHAEIVQGSDLGKSN